MMSDSGNINRLTDSEDKFTGKTRDPSNWPSQPYNTVASATVGASVVLSRPTGVSPTQMTQQQEPGAGGPDLPDPPPVTSQPSHPTGASRLINFNPNRYESRREQNGNYYTDFLNRLRPPIIQSASDDRNSDITLDSETSDRQVGFDYGLDRCINFKYLCNEYNNITSCMYKK